MKRKGLIFSFLIVLAASIGSAFSSYLISGDDKIGEEITVDGNVDNSFKRVTFLDTNGNLILKKYIKSGDTLTINDLPDNYKSAKYKRSDSNGVEIFSLDNNSFSNGLKITSDIELKASNILDGASTTVTTDSDFTFSPNNSGSYLAESGSGKFVINEGDQKGTDVTINAPLLNNIDADVNFITTNSSGKPSGEQSLSQNLGSNGSQQHSSDKTIGLEDSSSLSDIYKPKSGSTSSNANPLVTRLKLGCDTYLVGSSWLGIGARTGFYGADGWSQINFQGLINGSYCELDLNGHTLIIGNGATLELYGSLIDSSENKTGEVIVENGGTVKSTFVVEDHFHETSIPTIYLYGDAPFKMYRMPYLNAKVTFYKGSKLQGYFRLDFGGDSNSNYVDDLINIIGNDDKTIINTSSCSDYSYITRTPIWDNFWYSDSKETANIYNTEIATVENIVYQKFEYKFYNCNNLVINNPYFADIPYKLLISTIKIKINWDRCDFYIPPYFDFYLYNTNVKIVNNVNFLPGSYLYIDENSSIVLSAKEFGNQGKLVSRSLGLPDQFNISPSYQSVGGLMFINEKPYWTDAYKGRAEGNKNDGVNPDIFNLTTNFWSYQNKNNPSKADIYGEIEFDEKANLVKENYHLGGEINLYNLDKYVNNFSERVELYNSSFGVNVTDFKLFGSLKFNADFYCVLPLISEGNVITNMKTLSLRSDYKNVVYSFDKETGLIRNGSQFYGYTFCDNNGVYNNFNNRLNKSQYDDYNEAEYRATNDDLRAKFYPATLNENGSVSMNVAMSIGDTASYSFVYFRGAFFRFQNGKVDIFKFKGPNPDSNNGGFDENYSISVSYKDVEDYYGHDAWTRN